MRLDDQNQSDNVEDRRGEGSGFGGGVGRGGVGIGAIVLALAASYFLASIRRSSSASLRTSTAK